MAFLQAFLTPEATKGPEKDLAPDLEVGRGVAVG